MQILALLTTVVNLLAISASLWLGFYIITRSPHSALSRLGALLMWTLAVYLLSSVLLANVPGNIFISWLTQFSLLAIPVMVHLFVRLSAQVHAPRLLDRANRIGVPLAYLIAIGLIPFGPLPGNPPVGWMRANLAPATAPLGYETKIAPPLYPVFFTFLIGAFILTAINLWNGRKQTQHTPLAQPFTVILLAIILAGVGLTYGGLVTALQIPAQMFPQLVFLGAGIVLLGYAVARYAALLEGRPMDRDFLYAMLLVGSLTAFYFAILLVLYLAGQLSFFTLVLALIGTVAANSLFDGARIALDRIFYRRQFRTLRGNLRVLAREIGTSGPLSERLGAILVSLCRALQIRKGLIALKKADAWIVQASHNAYSIGSVLDASAINTNENIGVLLTDHPALPDFAVLIPLYAERCQIGALVLGARESAQTYSETDIEFFEQVGDEIGAMIRAVRVQEENAQNLDALVRDFRAREQQLELQLQQLLTARRAEPQPSVALDEDDLTHRVEDAMRRLYDFSYLGEHPLAQLRVVEQHLDARHAPTITFIERGKALSEVLAQTLNQLRPDGAPPGKNDVPPREWHPFIILYDSYVSDEPNRDIMSRLFIGEGTFNRTRRRALRALARSLAEIERQARGSGAVNSER